MEANTVTLGAVAYDPKVVTIWEGFRSWFAARGLAFDFVLYSNYERQVEGHFAGQFDVAWNSPLAWIETERLAAARGLEARAIAMRDTDRDLTSVVVVRTDAPIRSVDDLRGKRVAVGAPDSPQATLIPLLHLAARGLEPGKDFEVRRHDLLVGKHGDHIGGEREAAQALVSGSADAACMIDGNYLLFAQEGILPTGAARILATTEPYDHCNMTVLGHRKLPALERFRDLLLGMSYEDSEVRPLLDMEGLKRWVPGRTQGYAQLDRAVDLFHYLDAWIAVRQGT
jgi:ABC-type phosphate/phosphonate transport system substrate-binding protein